MSFSESFQEEDSAQVEISEDVEEEAKPTSQQKIDEEVEKLLRPVIKIEYFEIHFRVTWEGNEKLILKLLDLAPLIKGAIFDSTNGREALHTAMFMSPTQFGQQIKLWANHTGDFLKGAICVNPGSALLQSILALMERNNINTANLFAEPSSCTKCTTGEVPITQDTIGETSGDEPDIILGTRNAEGVLVSRYDVLLTYSKIAKLMFSSVRTDDTPMKSTLTKKIYVTYEQFVKEYNLCLERFKIVFEHIVHKLIPEFKRKININIMSMSGTIRGILPSTKKIKTELRNKIRNTFYDWNEKPSTVHATSENNEELKYSLPVKELGENIKAPSIIITDNWIEFMGNADLGLICKNYLMVYKMCEDIIYG